MKSLLFCALLVGSSRSFQVVQWQRTFQTLTPNDIFSEHVDQVQPEHEAQSPLRTVQFGILLVASLALGGEGARAADFPPPSQHHHGAPSLLVSKDDPSSVLELFGIGLRDANDPTTQLTREERQQLRQEEKEAKLREFDAKFEQDYQERNQLYSDKLKQKQLQDQKELQKEKQFLNQGIGEYQAVTVIPTNRDRGDSILPQKDLAPSQLPDIFSPQERAKIQARQEENYQKQQASIERSEAAQQEEENERQRRIQTSNSESSTNSQRVEAEPTTYDI